MGAFQSRNASVPGQEHNQDALDQNVRQAIRALLDHCKVPYAVKPYDQPLHDRCLALCAERGYPIGASHATDNEPSLLPFLRTGIYCTSISYPHFASDLPRLTYIALFTAFCAYMDDLFARDVDSVAAFGQRVLRGERQGHPVLDALAHMLATDTEAIFGRTAANLIVYDTLGFFPALLVSHETQSMRVSEDAGEYQNYIRLMNGIPAAYGMFIFPKDVPLTDYIQALPEIREYVCYSNDVLSYYKEELRGEDDTYIAIMATIQKLSRNEVLQKLAIDLGRMTSQVEKILSVSPAALHAWVSYKAGYVDFHMSDPRYQLQSFDFA